MPITLNLTLNRTPPAGDVVYPLRLLVSPEGGTLDAPVCLRAEAEVIAARLDGCADPGALILAVLSPPMADAGYRPLPHAGRAIIRWTAERVPPRPICPGLGRLRDLPACGWALSHPRADLPGNAWVVIADGTVAAAAWETDHGIAVETAPAYRRRGYGRAATAAAACAALAEGRAVDYRCAETNAASMALAASLGFVMAAREYHPGFRRC